MAVLQMQRMSICALKKDRKAILEKLQSMGVMEINHVLEEDEDFRRMDTANARLSFDKAAASADQALDILQQYAPVKQSLLSSLAGKDLIDKERFQTVIENKDELLKTAKRIQMLDKEKAELRANILKIENSIESLMPWQKLDVPMNFLGTAHMAMIPGTMPGMLTLENIYSMLAQQSPDLEVDVHIISAEQDTTYLTVFCLKKDAAQAEETLRSIGFAKPSLIIDQVPSKAKEEMEAEISGIQERIAAIEKEVIDSAVNREGLKLLADYYRVRAEKYDVLGQLPQSERTFLISGYVPTKEVSKVQKALTDKYDCVVDVEELKEDEEAPVLLKNNKFASSAEGILEAFGLPGKGELDPTAIMSVFYVFLFGLMLSDAAYGAIVSIVCGILILKFPRMGKGMKTSIQLFFWCGISTLFWGIMFGGYFGDVINVVSKTFFGHEVGIPAVWFVPLDEPMKLLIYSMLFGVIHLFTGLGIKGYMCLKDKKYMDFFCDVVLWYMLLVGLLIMLIPSDIFASIAQTSIVFPPAVNALGKGLAIVGAIGILLMSGRANKNFGLRIALGAYDLYNVSGWLSDVLSYSRLLALGLATGVIASVVNQMGSMGGKSVFGAIVFIFAFIVGHTFNIAINLLGAYVHTNRLQYVEFFGKFYEGGGRAFNPFKENTKYADIKEETNL
ncbi:V-type ATP synthase subunit I [Faecalicatena sp. AGMB00832]|uniref:V-type ATP synthase subunit I n=1 Tax=Faecalicatena faecalis TaxID=2726362 RepID=A0ABS6D3X0_9FIRM|nr:MULTISPECIES: V-type ATP synthase subunit I [Faecalicatena]MBU3875922.1 V-type ATP synthase subunit I [Faecalicatena faecalis]MCI6467618.1 V-type ATP synthase subunit I [Faecalicatena sp.]MDY5619794.1 V-type ATP synthase subunit I [Lachnospiraceae bacterium]